MKALLLAILIAGSLRQIASGATLTGYTNYHAWLAAMGSLHAGVSVTTENFNSGNLAVPGLAITTRSGFGNQPPAGQGSIVQGAWSDWVGKNAPLPYDSTTIAYNQPLYGIGGFWALPNPAGTLDLWANTATTSWNPTSPNNDGSTFSGWWGFTSSEPFSQVLLGTNSGSVEFGLDNLVLAQAAGQIAVPEPQTTALLALLLVFLWIAKARRVERSSKRMAIPKNF